MTTLKHIYKTVLSAAVAVLAFASCTDPIEFGSAFLDKKPDANDATIDTLFTNPVYVRQALSPLYSMSYYGLPFGYRSSAPFVRSSYGMMFDDVTDCYVSTYTGTPAYGTYYNGTLTSLSKGDQLLYDFRTNNIFECIRNAWLLIENIDKCQTMDPAERRNIVAQAKCIIASRMFDMFKMYGGLPIIKGSVAASGSYDMPRQSVATTVSYIQQLINESLADLPWQYSSDDLKVEEGRWTQAAAMAMKCKVWAFAASPLFNSAEPYYSGKYDMAGADSLVWYGGYHAELWDSLYNSCRDFFTRLDQKGGYALETASASKPTPAQYCYAYRRSYLFEDSKEVLMSNRVTTIKGSYNQERCQERGMMVPTLELMAMYGWADGTPFDTTTIHQHKSDLFVTGDITHGDLTYTRDPRLYENVIVTGMAPGLSSSGALSGDMAELWVGGNNAKQNSVNETSQYGTGLANNKYYINGNTDKLYKHWAYLRLSDLYLTYAEAFLQKGQLAEARAWIDKVRARVGLKGLADCYPASQVNDKEGLLELLLKERACELALEDARYFDLIRYKRADLFEKPLHKLLTYRLDDKGNRVETKFKGSSDQKKKKYFPQNFDYEIHPLKAKRLWWSSGYDVKWYLQPWPLGEINKGYGLLQNPGW